MTDDDLPHRGGKPLPDGFGPLEPIWGSGDPAPVRDPDAPRPRSRLTSSALRRNAPDMAVVASPAPAPVAPAAVEDAGAVREVATPTRPGSRRTTVVGAALGVLLVVGGATAVLWPGGGQGDEAVAVERAVRSPATASELDPPADLAPDTELVETNVLEGGDLRVTHWISTTTPVDEVTLGWPRSPDLAEPDHAIDDVVVAADGVRLDVDLRTDTSAATAITATESLYVQYVLPGAVDRTGSAAGRGLATVTALDVGLGGRSLARMQAFAAGDVLTLACLADGARAVPQPCGARVGDTWQVESPADDRPVTVIAQLDLSASR
ncbi:hypothetical protein EUA93_05390 [Nocardioides oleivorans]|uniref:Uncharacterized protein n=1 Tax=Nocardioides oleivorans TaxID=273676 RepID=A0A4V1RKX9_9ACTN|nr:hypothetical protein [Nocardioides oleivorans]RYB93842.1 hypothetical protein EUA93_05390 [Nocardioides oleivorans]